MQTNTDGHYYEKSTFCCANLRKINLQRTTHEKTHTEMPTRKMENSEQQQPRYVKFNWKWWTWTWLDVPGEDGQGLGEGRPSSSATQTTVRRLRWSTSRTPTPPSRSSTTWKTCNITLTKKNYSDPAWEDADGAGEGAGDDQGLHQLHCGEILWWQPLACSYGDDKNSCGGKSIDNTLWRRWSGRRSPSLPPSPSPSTIFALRARSRWSTLRTLTIITTIMRIHKTGSIIAQTRINTASQHPHSSIFVPSPPWWWNIQTLLERMQMEMERVKMFISDSIDSVVEKLRSD